MSHFRLRQRTVIVPPPQTFTYDTSIGNGVDTSGFADLPLRSGAKRFFVSSSTGNDTRTITQAQSSVTPLATVSAALAFATTGAGDQILVAEGSSFSSVLPSLNLYSGFSALYPTVVQSYDPADALNETKYGRASDSNRPVFNTGATATQDITGSVTTPAKYLAIRGLKFNPGNVSGMNIGFTGSNGLSNSYVLFENNVLAYSGLSFNQDNRSKAHHIVIRGNSFYGQWDSSQDARGLYISGASHFTVEDNFFYHVGWKIGASRDDTTANGGTTVRRHSIYQQDDADGIVRRNLSIDPSATSFSLRGGVDAYGNVSIDAPIGIIGGKGTFYQFARPAGSPIYLSANAMLGDADINTSLSRGGGIDSGNGKNGSKARFNLVARSRNPSATSSIAFSTNTSIATNPSYMDFHDNVEYLWAAAGQVHVQGDAGFEAYVHDTYESNAWSDPASGSNVNIASHSMPITYTSAQLYAALSLTDKATAIARWQEHPEDRPARSAMTLLSAGYAMITQYAEDLFVSKTAFIATAPYVATIMGAMDGSTISISGNPTSITLDSDKRTLTYDGTGSATSGSFILTETPASGTAHNTTISYSIAAQPTLGTLTLSPAIVSGTPSSGSIVGAYGTYADSYIEVSGAPAGFLPNSSNGDASGSGSPGAPSRLYTYDGTPFTGSFTIYEYLTGATNSPHASTIS